MPRAKSTAAAKTADAVKPRAYRPAAERRAQIIAAAQTVFVRSNFQGARTREIAQQAGVNEATLFKHFPTKDALFEAAVMAPLIEAMTVPLNLHTRRFPRRGRSRLGKRTAYSCGLEASWS